MSNSLVIPVTTPNRSNPSHPVRDTHHGVVAKDEFRWLEDGKDPDGRTWTDSIPVKPTEGGIEELQMLHSGNTRSAVAKL